MTRSSLDTPHVIVVVREPNHTSRRRNDANTGPSVRPEKSWLDLSSASEEGLHQASHQHQRTTTQYTSKHVVTTLSPSAAPDARTVAEANGLPRCCHRALQHKNNHPPNSTATTSQEQMVYSSSSSRKEYGTYFELAER